MSHIALPDAIGVIGVTLIVFAYARIQWQRDYVRTLSYSAMNLMGTVFLVVSFIGRWNMPSFVYCTVWEIFSLYGVYRCLNYMRRAEIARRLGQ